MTCIDGKDITQMTCIVCPVGCGLSVEQADGEVKVTGNRCSRGVAYARAETTRPVRTVTGTVVMQGGGLMPVRTRTAIDKALIPDALAVMHALRCPRQIAMGDVLAADIAGSGVDLIACDDGPTP